MSEVKAPKNADAGSKTSEAKTSEVKKPEVKKPESEPSAAASETSPADKSAGKADATPKSASQTSISHFSSVSTPAYRSGWNSIFGDGKTTKKTKSKTGNGSIFPDHLAIEDEDIDTDLRNILYKSFQRQARKQGISLSKIRKIVNIEYVLHCNVKEK
jgi:hypothetical protein